MPDENKKKGEPDIFIAKSIYPEAASVFTTRFKTLDEIKEDCYVVLDTNVLLAPYTIGETDLLDQCRRIYSSLIKQGRLIIPGQVAREFAKNRAAKLAELYQRLSRRKQQPEQKQSEKYPLLSSLQDYQEVIRLEKEIDTKIQERQKAIERVLNYIQGWQWNDPVSQLYSDLFTESIVIEPSITEEEIGKDLDRRLLHTIPPGYKDAAKEDRGVGDLIIWHTILEIGRKEKKSVIFVSGEEKADWFQKSEKLALYPRYELVDEFRRASGGQSFYIIRFSRFLELFGASEELVEEVRQEEKILNAQIEILGNRDIYIWYMTAKQNLQYINEQLSSFVKLGDFNVDQLKGNISVHFTQLVYLYDKIPSAIDKRIKTSFGQINDKLSEMLTMEIRLEDDKSLEEFISLVEELRSLISRLMISLSLKVL